MDIEKVIRAAIQEIAPECGDQYDWSQLRFTNKPPLSETVDQYSRIKRTRTKKKKIEEEVEKVRTPRDTIQELTNVEDFTTWG